MFDCLKFKRWKNDKKGRCLLQVVKDLTVNKMDIRAPFSVLFNLNDYY